MTEARDVISPELDALAGQVQAGLEALARSTTAAWEAVQQDFRNTETAIDEVLDVVAADPRLAANVERVKITLAEDRRTDERQADAFGAAMQIWSADLDRLRGLGR